MRRILLTLLIAISSVLAIQAQGDGTDGATVVRAEYFFDTDPGYGNATIIDNVTSGDNNLSLSVEGLSPGAHMLYVRSQASTGVWSATQAHPLLLLRQRPTEAVRVEYFYDTDPGYGHGKSMGNLVDGDNTLVFSVEGLASGVHHLCLRAQDNTGVWSQVATSSIFVASPKTANAVRIEYFFDTDPGYGQAMAITPSQDETATYALSLDNLSMGAHMLYLRVQDNHGRWSAVQKHPIYVLNNLPDVVAAEYFFDDNDPGEGQATAVPLPNVKTEPFAFEANTEGLAPGEHHLMVRLQKNNGFWTLYDAAAFTVEGVAGPEPYAVLSENNTVLTFYYDDQKEARNGMNVGPFSGYVQRGWHSVRSSIAKVMFDDSFALYSPTSTALWFWGLQTMTEIVGLENLHTDQVTDMNGMFHYCYALETLDLSHFNTAAVTNIAGMFYGCNKLKTITVGEGWTTDNIITTTISGTGGNGGWQVFSQCTSLVGGAGTTFDAGHTDYTYAHIDGGPSNPGYFTDKNASEIVEAPTFRFEGDSLFIETATKDASIFYQMAELPNMDEATIEKISSSLTVTADVQQSIYYEQPIELKKSVVLKAIAAGATESEVSTLVYDYDAWQKLLEALDYALDVSGRASDNSNVPDQLKGQLSHMIEEGKGAYHERMWESQIVTSFTDEMMQLAHQIDEMMKAVVEPEPYAVLTGDTISGMTLTFYYDGQKAARNGMSVEPFKSRQSVPWYNDRKSITSVVFDESFANCATITSTAYWFHECENLTGIINLGYLNTTQVTTMRHMFYGCQKLTSLDVSHFDTSNVTDMYGTFQALFELPNLDVSGFNTSKVTTMVWMFGNCHKLQALDVSGFDTSNVTDMTFMFAGCNDLSNIDVSGFDTKKVTRMTEMFGSCKTLTALDVTNFNTANVYNFDYMFSGCTGLTSLDVSHFDTSNAVSMTDMFGSCYGLTTLDVSHFNTSKVTNMNSLFRNCTNLLDINMSNFNTANVTDMADIFTECTSLASIQAGSAMIPANEYAKVENPNLLLYVNEASLAPQGIQNVVVNDFAKNIVLTDVESGNNNFYCPKEFKAEMISYTRDFQQQTEIGVSRGWESIALPFNVQTIMHEKRGLIAPFGNDASDKHFWLRRLTQEGVVRATAIEANTPYLISMPNSSEYPAEYNLSGRVTFSSQDMTVPVTTDYADVMHDTTAHTMIVFYPAMLRVHQDEDVYALNVGHAQAGYAEGSVFVAGLREVRPFEAYTWHHAQGPAPRYIPISELDGGATGIEDVRSLMSDGRGDSWYDLNGRRLQKKPTQKGVYILNGPKIVIK